MAIHQDRDVTSAVNFCVQWVGGYYWQQRIFSFKKETNCFFGQIPFHHSRTTRVPSAKVSLRKLVHVQLLLHISLSVKEWMKPEDLLNSWFGACPGGPGRGALRELWHDYARSASNMSVIKHTRRARAPINARSAACNRSITECDRGGKSTRTGASQSATGAASACISIVVIVYDVVNDNYSRCRNGSFSSVR